MKGRRVVKLLLNQTQKGKCRLTFTQLNQIQSHLLTSGALSDHYLAAKALSLFARSSSSSHLRRAQSLFLSLRRRTTFTWNTILMAFTSHNQTHTALLYYKNMLLESVSPNNYTFSFLLRLSSATADLLLGSTLHAQTLKLGWDAHAFVLNGLAFFYIACGRLDSALLFLNLMHCDVVTWTALIDGCLKSGDFDKAHQLFDEMPERNCVTWSAMINGYVKCGLWEEALQLFNLMQASGFCPNEAAVVGALSACACLGALDQGRWIHTHVGRRGMVMDMVLGSALVDMYARCGSIGDACEVFNSTPNRDVFAFTSLISGLSNHGRSKEAIELFRKMEDDGIRPNEVTFVCVLSACGRMGLVEEGMRIFERMVGVYGMEAGVQHYGCLVDLIGRAGMMEEAKEVVRNMSMEPDCYVLGALLNACRVHGNVELGEEIVASLMERRLDHGGSHILLSNIYAWEKKWHHVAKVRKAMEEIKVKKIPGCSSIEVDGVIFEFVAGRNFNTLLMDHITPFLFTIAHHLKSSRLHDDDEVPIHD